MWNFSRLDFRLLVLVIITIVISLLFIDRGDEYCGEVIPSMEYDLYQQIIYSDLNKGGKSEKLRIVQTAAKSTGIIVYNEKGELIDQYNFRGRRVPFSELICEDLEGDVMPKRFSVLGIGKVYKAFPLNGEIWIADSKLKISRISTNLDPIEDVSASFTNGVMASPIDLVGDEAPEVVGTDLGTGIYFRTAVREYFERVEPNRVRKMFFVYASLIFAVIYALTYIIIHHTRQQKLKKQEREKQFLGLQLQLLKNQVNLHFIFNALNSISAMYIRGENEKADSFLTGFSRLIREVVVSSERTIVTLEEELRFVTSYLDLEKVRLGDQFRYTINLPANCRKIEIPSMAIHTFVENAIKHGLKDLTDERLLEIGVIKFEKGVEIIISDNGPGFGLSRSTSGSTGKGLENVSNIFKSYTGISGKKISWSVSGKGTTINSVGTTIIISSEI